MADQLTVTITGKDGISKVFQEVTRSADKMADTLESAGTEGAKGLDKLGKEAQDASKDMEDAGKGAKSFGDGLDTLQINMAASAQNLQGLSEFLGVFSDAQRENERQTLALSKLYGDAAGEMAEYARQIQETTNYSNEQAQQAAITFGTLQTQYGLTTEQIKELITVSADLAAISGMDLVDAATRVQAAIRGEGEAAEALGLTMNQQSIDRENLTLSMTNQEAAQFRLTALLEQATFAQGTANQMAQGSIGTYESLANTFQDVTVSVSDALGPIPLFAGGLANIASQSFTVIGGGAALINMFRGIGTSATTARIASAGLALALNPVTLAVTAVGAAAAIGFGIWRNHRQSVEEAEAAYEQLQGAIKITDDTIRNLNLAGKFELAAEIKAEIDESRAALDQFNNDLADIDWFGNLNFEDAPGAWEDFAGKAFGEEFRAWLVTEGYLTQEAIDQMMAGNADVIQRNTPIIQAAARDFYEEFKLDDTTRGEIEAAMQPLYDLFTNPNIDATKLDAEMDKLFQAFASKKITADELTSALEFLFTDITAGADSFNILSDNATEAQAALKETAATADELSKVVGDLSGTLLDLEFQGMDQAAADLEALGNSFNLLLQGVGPTVDEFGNMIPAIGLTADGAARADMAFDALTDAILNGADSGKILIDVLTILNDPNLSPDQKAQALFDYAAGLDEAAASAEALALAHQHATDAINTTGVAVEKTATGIGAIATASDLATEAIERNAAAQALLEQRIQAHNEAMTAWIGNGDNILALLGEMDINFTQFGESFRSAFYTDQVAGEIDYLVSTVFGAIDEIEGRLGSMTSITDKLFGGDYTDGVGPLVDALDAGVISIETFNSAVEAGIEIEENAAQSTLYLTKMRADQLPLLAEQSAAYEEQLRALSELGPAEQQRALYMQSSAGQTAIATQYATAYSASLGEIPPEVATEMIVNAAEADPILKSLLLDMGLLTETDGEIKVNFPDGPTVQEAVMSLTDSIDALTIALGGVPPLRLKVDGQDELDAAAESLAPFTVGAGSPIETKVDISVSGEENLVPITEIGDEPIIGNVELALDQPSYAAVDQSLTDVENTELVVPVTFDVEDLHNLAGGGNTTGPETITITVEADTDDAEADMAAVNQSLADTDGESALVEIDGDNNEAIAAIREAERILQDIDGDTSTVIVRGDNDHALDSISDVDSALSNIDGDDAWISVNADTSDAWEGINWASGMDGATLANVYIDINYRVNGSVPSRHGGIPGLAGGGLIPVELAEAGPEIAHFAGGGSMTIEDRGIYPMPLNTFIEPANSVRSRGAGGGVTISVPIYGNVYGIDDLMTQVADRIVPAWMAAIDADERGQGVS